MPLDFYRFGLIGYPLGHSLSPQLHQAALAHYGLTGEYLLYPVAPQPSAACGHALDALARSMRRGELHGLNVTIPHKSAMFTRVDRLSRTAASVGAVNTISLAADGALEGDNTDVPGFLADLGVLLGEHEVNGDGRTALVLGAGGSARAVVYALASRGWQVYIAARRLEQARSLMPTLRVANHHYLGRFLKSSFTRKNLLPFRANAVRPLLDQIALIVNTTPVGMSPQPDASPWFDDLPLPPHAAVYDLVYNPIQTRLVAQALDAALPARTGGGMLAAQAALAFAQWTGLEPPFDVMLAALSA